jgi:D-alanine-D-alanine ligase
VSRADFRFDDRIEGMGGLICLEVNTQPGIAETSLRQSSRHLRA